jgi:hypothetical protein
MWARPALAGEGLESPESPKAPESTWGWETDPPEESEPAPIEGVIPEPEVPGGRVCILIAYVKYQPAKLELGPSLRIGYTRRWDPDSAENRLSLGASVNTTFALGVIGHEEVRLGPFVGIESSLDRFRGEGGLELALQRADDMSDDLSAALAFGAGVDDRGVPHGVATLSFGHRYVKERYSEHGACTAPDPPASFGLASTFRLFVTYRQEFRERAMRELSAGLEFGIPRPR